MKPLLLIWPLMSVVALLIPAQDADIKMALQQKVAAAKESAARNQAALRQYSWTAHTEIALKGEVKKTKDELCRYSPDGKVQKTSLNQPEPQKKTRGLKGKIAEKKKDELENYMERATSLIHRYVPPNSQIIQQAFQAGNVMLGQGGPGAVQLHFKNYLLQGDSFVLTMDAAAKVLRKVNVNSYLDNPQDAVTLEVDFQTLPDGTNYSAVTTLNATAKKVQVKIRNFNYQRP